MAEPILSYELKSLLNKIKSELTIEFPIQVISLNYLVLAILDNQFCDGYDVISKLMMDPTIEEFRQYIIDRILIDCTNSLKQNDKTQFSNEYDNLAEEIANDGFSVVTSSLMLNFIIRHDDDMAKKLTKIGVTTDQMLNAITEQISNNNIDSAEITPKKKSRKKTTKSKKNSDEPKEDDIPNIRIIPEENNIVEINCTNLVREASKGTYDNIVGFDKEINTIFDVLGKYDRNTVAIVGERGVGKTSLIYKLAKRLYDFDCPKPFRDKYLMKFEDAITSLIIKEMNRLGKYIAFIDDVERLFVNKEAEANNMFVLTELFKSPNISTIIVVNDAAYAKYIDAKPEFARYIHKVMLNEPDDDDLTKILKCGSRPYSEYNNVVFSDENITDSIRLAKRFITNEKCPRAALNILDASASYVRMHTSDSEKLMDLRKKLKELTANIASIPSTASADEFDKKDELIREQIALNKSIKVAEKDEEEKKLVVTSNDIKSVVSELTNVPITEMGDDEKERLKKLEYNLKSVVIGQDDVVVDVVKAVKRQRVGLSNPNKPVVMLFVGTTGTGKSFLAKRLAYEMFGDEKNIVRLDMSEYADKTSVNKMYGSSPGYIGYEEGGVLTEAIKRNNRCVLLLDEIEKAHEDVFNVLLQVFDEGRLTDNKGTLIDFKNVIIIMTSNVGAKNISEKTSAIGFGKHDDNLENKEIILKSIKKAFKPEFINRIDNICYFNKLTDDSLRRIITNEIDKVTKKVRELGYDLDETITRGKIVDSIFDSVKDKSEYGARPILREIQQQLEDKLTDYMIDNNMEDGYVFTYSDIY